MYHSNVKSLNLNLQRYLAWHKDYIITFDFTSDVLVFNIKHGTRLTSLHLITSNCCSPLPLIAHFL